MFKIKKYTKDFNKKEIPIALIYKKKDVKDGTPLKSPIKMICVCPFDEDEDEVIDDIAIKERLKIDPLKCPLCLKVFTRKYNTTRHLDTACPFKKVQKFNKSKTLKSSNVNSIELNKNEIICSQFPNPYLRDICYVAAPYGAGKSTYTENYIKSFMELFEPSMVGCLSDESDTSDESDYSDCLSDESDDSQPSKNIFLISRIEDDKAFRGMIESGVMTEIDISDPSLIDEPLDAKKELSNSLVVFDDYELLDKKIQKSIMITLNDVMLNGRDQADKGNDIYAVITSHQITNYQKTRDILNECSSITIFPKSGSTYQIKRALKTYCGMGKKEIEKLLMLPSRWVTIYKRYPMWVLYSKGVYKLV